MNSLHWTRSDIAAPMFSLWRNLARILGGLACCASMFCFASLTGGQTADLSGLTPALPVNGESNLDSTSFGSNFSSGSGFNDLGGFGNNGSKYNPNDPVYKAIGFAQAALIQSRAYHQYMKAETDRAVAYRHWQVNRWIQFEFDALRKYHYQLSKAERLLERQKRQFELLTRKLKKLPSGKGTQQDLNALVKALNSLQTDSELQALFESPVSPLPSNQFNLPSSSLRRVGLTLNGKVAPPPLVLSGLAGGRDHGRLYRRVSKAWQMCIDQIQVSDVIESSQVREFKEAVKLWREQSASNLAHADIKNRALGSTYLRRLQALAENLQNPQGVQRLKQHMDGYDFEGGNMAELIRHLLKFGILPRYGSQANTHLEQLATACIQRTVQQYETLDLRISALRAKDISHSSLVRTKLGTSNPSGIENLDPVFGEQRQIGFVTGK